MKIVRNLILSAVVALLASCSTLSDKNGMVEVSYAIENDTSRNTRKKTPKKAGTANI